MGKSRLITFTLLIVALFLFNTCEEEFTPEIDKYEEVLVVEGRISNASGPHKVRLTKSSEYGDISEKFVVGAAIMIIDDLENQYPLIEDELGDYYTQDSFSAQIGRSYKIQITIDGNVFESTMQKVNEVQDVDSVYWEQASEILQTDDGDVEISGIKLFLDSYDQGDDDRYFIWDYDETWEFKVQYEVDDYQDKYICWASSSSSDFHVGTTNDVISSNIVKEPIVFIKESENKLAIKYSINVHQYDVDKDVYDFYSLLNQQKDNVGTLFDKTPVTIQGNISCINNSKIPVLGLFQVSGVKSHRIFIENEELPSDLSFNISMKGCEMEYVGSTDELRLLEMQAIGMLFLDSVAGPANTTLYRFVTSHTCYDCTRTGFPNLPPDYWK